MEEIKLFYMQDFCLVFWISQRTDFADNRLHCCVKGLLTSPKKVQEGIQIVTVHKVICM